MPIITPAQATRLQKPPQPPPPDVRLIEPDGRPTRDWHNYLTRLYEWQRRLYTILTE